MIIIIKPVPHQEDQAVWLGLRSSSYLFQHHIYAVTKRVTGTMFVTVTVIVTESGIATVRMNLTVTKSLPSFDVINLLVVGEMRMSQDRIDCCEIIEAVTTSVG